MNTIVAIALSCLLLVPGGGGKNKKSFFANYIGNARYVAVIPLQGKDFSSQSPDDLLAASAVEVELRKWKRFQVVSKPGDADLIIAVRRGRIADAKIGTGGRWGVGVGPNDDLFEVYMSRGSSPLDSAPIWKLYERDSLASPGVTAVATFKKAVEEAEKP